MNSLRHFRFGWIKCAEEYFILCHNLCHCDPNFKQCVILEVMAFSQDARDITNQWKRETILSPLGYQKMLEIERVQPHCSSRATKKQQPTTQCPENSLVSLRTETPQPLCR